MMHLGKLVIPNKAVPSIMNCPTLPSWSKKIFKATLPSKMLDHFENVETRLTDRQRTLIAESIVGGLSYTQYSGHKDCVLC